MSSINLKDKGWLIPFARAVQDGFDMEAARRAVAPHLALPPAERVTLWCDEALHRRGLLVGAPTTCWRDPDEELDHGKPEWYHLNLLAHQLELLGELRLLFGREPDRIPDRLESLAVLAACIDELDAADELADLMLEQWGGPDDPRRKELRRALIPLSNRIGSRLAALAPDESHEPLLGLPFHHVLSYKDTRRLIDVAVLFARDAGRPDLLEVPPILARSGYDKVHMIEAIIALATADDTITRVERRLIDSVIELARLPDDDRKLVLEAFDQPPTPEQFGGWLTDPLDRRFLYSQLEVNTLLEGDGANPPERELIDALARAFELTEDDQLVVQAEALGFLESNPDLVDAFSLGDTLLRFKRSLTRRVESVVKLNLGKLVTEVKETGELTALLARRARGKLDADEEKRARDQLLDICKTIPSLAIFALPGGAVLLPIVLKLIPNLLPSAFADKEEQL